MCGALLWNKQQTGRVRVREETTEDGTVVGVTDHLIMVRKRMNLFLSNSNKSLDHRLWLLWETLSSLTSPEGATQQDDNLGGIWRVSGTTSYHRFQVGQP